MHHHAVVRWTVAVALAGASVVPVVSAQEAPKTLPTLLIKGEVVSVDTSDPNAALLKVKDRYGFETPIYLSQDTKIRQGDQTLAVANLTSGTAVEVEYNFDINTAKRHAVSVSVSAPAAAAAATPVAAPAAPEATASAPAAPAQAVAPTEAAAPAAAPSPTSESAPTQPAAASTTPEQPAATTTQ